MNTVLTPWERQELIEQRIYNARHMAKHFTFLASERRRMAKMRGYKSEWQSLTDAANDAEDTARSWDLELKRLQAL